MRHRIQEIKELCKSGKVLSFKTQGRSIRTNQGIESTFRHQIKAQAARKDPSMKTRKDPSMKTRKDPSMKTRPKQDKIEYAMATHRPSSTLKEPHFPVIYGENIDYAIKIVEHFLHFLPGGKIFFLYNQHRNCFLDKFYKLIC